MGVKFDFGGYATKNDVTCADGLTIRKNAFRDMDGEVVPLVYQHNHNDNSQVIGHCLLENRDDGVYCYGSLNNTPAGRDAREQIQHGDITKLSIWANNLVKRGADVMHGVIREVSLVLSGANPGAVIDFPMIHSEDGYYRSESEAQIYTDDSEIIHSDVVAEGWDEEEDEELMHADEGGDVGDIDIEAEYNGLNARQKQAVNILLGFVAEQASGGEAKHADEGGEAMNVFDQSQTQSFNPADELMHTNLEDSGIMADAIAMGSLKKAVLAHSQDYGIENLDVLLPDAQNVGGVQVINREQDWVSTVLNGTSHSPFSRIKTTVADWTFEEARARGYIKGHMKKEEVISLMKRTITPTTIYKKQRLDRDDIVDITTLDIVNWIKGEMRVKLNEEIARAILVGDGREIGDEDKINEDCIIPIIKEKPLFKEDVYINFPVSIAGDYDEKVRYIIRAITKARKHYKGSGQPRLFTTEDGITDMILIEDKFGHRLYKTEAEVAAALRVSGITPVQEFLENITTEYNGETYYLYGILVNLKDYTIGADKGGCSVR